MHRDFFRILLFTNHASVLATVPVQPNMVQYHRVPPQKVGFWHHSICGMHELRSSLVQAGAPGARPHNLHPQHRASMPMLLPVDTSVPPAIGQHRRPSAPAALTFAHTAPGQSPVSASPSNTFAGLSLASLPSTPVSSRPSTASGHIAPLPRHPSGSRPASSVGIHVTPPFKNNPSSSSLAGAIVDLTQDESREDSARKRRKLEHVPGITIPQAAGVAPIASPATPISENMHSGPVVPSQAVVARPFTVPQVHSQFRPTSVEHPHRIHPPQPVQQAVASIPPHNPLIAAPQPYPPQTQTHPPLSQIIAHSLPMPQQLQLTSQPPQPPSQHQPSSQSQLPPKPQQSAQPQPQPPPQAPPVRPSNASSSTAAQPDVVMADAASEPVPTLEEESIEANYDEDEDDETKRWCRMCRWVRNMTPRSWMRIYSLICLLKVPIPEWSYQGGT